jgi:tetratricopeptide (TPR) repeat protein
MIAFVLAAIVWQTDWNAAFAQAKQQHKLVFVDYYQNKCMPCQDVERLVMPNDTMQRELADFVALKVDLDRSAIPREHRYAPPSYVVFDWAGRERFRIDGEHNLRADDWRETLGEKNPLNYPLYAPLDTFRGAIPAFVEAAELFDAKRDLEAHFLVGTTYSRLKMPKHARAAFAEAKKLAEEEKKPALMQSAEVQSAYSFVHQGRAAHAVELLSALTKSPIDRATEAIIWLTLGHAYVAATDKPNAVEAFRRAQSLAPANSRTRKDATAALARLE